MKNGNLIVLGLCLLTVASCQVIVESADEVGGDSTSETTTGDSSSTGDSTSETTTGDSSSTGDSTSETTTDTEVGQTTTDTSTGEPVCGDGVQEGGEECDDGNQENDDDCTTSCLNAFCGDGLVHLGVEGCDGNNLNGTSCQSFGFAGGSLGCQASCEFDISNCNN